MRLLTVLIFSLVLPVSIYCQASESKYNVSNLRCEFLITLLKHFLKKKYLWKSNEVIYGSTH